MRSEMHSALDCSERARKSTRQHMEYSPLAHVRSLREGSKSIAHVVMVF